MSNINKEGAMPPSDYRLTLETTSHAVANGHDRNHATARLTRNDIPLAGQEVMFAVDGDAKFTNGAQQVTAATDRQGDAVASFTDTLPETVQVLCHYHQLFTSRSATFQPGQRLDARNISVEQIVDDVPANGNDANLLRYRVFDGSNQPIVGIFITFSANPASTHLSATEGITNANGTFDLYIRSQQAGQALIIARLTQYPAVDNYTYVNFIPVTYYQIDSFTNENYAPINSGRNRITFTLSQRNGVPVAGQILLFAVPVGSGASVTPTSGVTNAQGQVEVSITSSVVGLVLVQARLNSDLSVSTGVFVEFTSGLPQYSIVNDPRVNNSPANGIAQNVIVYTLFTRFDQIVPNQTLLFDVTGDAQLSASQGITDSAGQFTLQLTSRTAEDVTVTARVQSDTASVSRVVMTFV
ncbi:Ig-like domain-containing protein [Martelella alba]|uniref:Big-1 domain-containing protein n=1 Tax=Martelella alba TaxID=2590451 RepID=A0ABY2SMG8_9HYPH|nr:Ig-like domain-containing protein [Martelella alba]TKI06983.1 hypothetical protein FCN80_08535 [Martelella alba]